MRSKRKTAIRLARVAGIAVAVTGTLAIASSSRGSASSATSHLRVRTLMTVRSTVLKFAQDGGRVAWLSQLRLGQGNYQPCRISIQTLSTGARWTRTVDRTDDCPGSQWLALAGRRALWALASTGNNEEVSVETAVQGGKPRALALLENVAAAQAPSEYFDAMAGDRSTLVYSVSGLTCHDIACSPLEDPNTGFWRLSSGRRVRLAGVPEAQAIAAAGGRIALVPQPAMGDPATALEVRDVSSGALIAHSETNGKVAAIALSNRLVAALVRVPAGTKVELFDARSGEAAGSTLVPGVFPGAISIAGQSIVFSGGAARQGIWLLDTMTKRLSLLTRVGQGRRAIGLSVEGRRVAWAVNVNGHGRIEELILPAS